MYGTLISTQTLASTAASVTFSSIPGTYTDLYLVISARTANAVTDDVLQLQFNGDTTAANYSFVRLVGTGSSASSAASTTYFYAGPASGASATANTFGNSIVTIPNYASSTAKVGSTDGVDETNGSAALQGLYANKWSGTAAITSILVQIIGGGNLAVGSVLSLYGLTHA